MIEMESILKEIISNSTLHAKWINTLSYMENCGARLIAQSEHPTMVQEEILRHAAEEFRHAYFFKAQIEKISFKMLPTYQIDELLAGRCSKYYLCRLNLLIARLLKPNCEVDPSKFKYYCYLLVTYAIEVRAEKIYPLYQDLLKKSHSQISIHHIIRDEKHHLDEINTELRKTEASKYLIEVCEAEEKLFEEWKQFLEKDAFHGTGFELIPS